MIRGVKGMFAVVALAGVGLGLRWMTAGSISGVSSYDLDSMTVLAVGTVAWMAYGWLVLAVVMTVLEQLPGAIGALAGFIARRITSTTARTLLRSSLGVAAVTPLTVGVAHATPGDGHVHPWTEVEPRSTVQLTDTNAWRATEPASRVRLTEQAPGAVSAQSISRTDASNSQTTTPAPGRAAATNRTHPTQVAATTHPDPTGAATTRGTHPTRVAVPDRPATGAATRYTDLRSGTPVRVPRRLVVKAGDSLWSLAARELGPEASAAAVAARWPEWYAANRQVIGSDPDLILPGQVLRIPAAATDQHVPPTHQEK
jgi:LysM repeat protein